MPRLAPGSIPTRRSAPASTVQRDALPPAAADLDDAQRAFLEALATGARGGELGRRDRPGRHLRHCHGARPAGRARLHRDLPCLPRAAVRATRRMAAGGARPRLRDPAPARGGRRGGGGVSVGLQRLRDEPDLLRRATADKGEDPALVDRALDLAEQRRVLVAELDAAKARRNTVSEQIAEAVRAGADPGSPDLVRAEGCLPPRIRRHQATRSGPGDRPGRPGRRDAAHPEPGRSRRAGGRGGGERHGSHVGRAPAPRGSAPALGDRGAARPDRQRARREDHRLRLAGLPRAPDRTCSAR